MSRGAGIVLTASSQDCPVNPVATRQNEQPGRPAPTADMGGAIEQRTDALVGGEVGPTNRFVWPFEHATEQAEDRPGSARRLVEVDGKP